MFQITEMTFSLRLSRDPSEFTRWILWSGLWNVTISSRTPAEKKSAHLQWWWWWWNLWIIPCLHSPPSLLILLPPSCSPSVSLDISVVTAPGPPRSWEGRSPTGRSASPRTSSHRSDWSGWWCRPRGSPVLPRSPAQSRTAPYSWAAPEQSCEKVEEP